MSERMKSGPIIGSLLLAAMLVAGFLWLMKERRDDGGGNERRSSTATPPQTLPPLPAPATVAAAPAREKVAPGDVGYGVGLAPDNSPPEDPALKAQRLPAPGFLKVRVVSGADGQPVPRVAWRLSTEARYAELEPPIHEGLTTLRLTPGLWEARLTAAGFEARSLSFDIASAAATDLGDVVLAVGRGSIEGVVVAPPRLPGLNGARGPVGVELYGEGRAPCPHCRVGTRLERIANTDQEQIDQQRINDLSWDVWDVTKNHLTKCCGWFPNRSVVAVGDSGRFRFENLAAGKYWVRAVDPEHERHESRLVRLEPDGHARLEFDLTVVASLTLTMVDDEGRLFPGEWESPHREETAPFHVRVCADGLLVAEMDLDSEAEAVRGRLGPPPLPDPPRDVAGVDDTGAAASIGIGLSRLFHDPNARVDRERRDSDQLAPEPAPPQFGWGVVMAGSSAPGTYQVRPLPRGLLAVSVTCGDWSSGELAVDLRENPAAELRAALRLDDFGRRWRELIPKGPPFSCLECHGGVVSFEEH